MSIAQTPLDVWAAVPFSDSSELVQAMSDPRYKNNTVHPNLFVAAVERKLALSEGVGTDSVRSTTSESFRTAEICTDAIVDGSVAEQQRAEQAAALEEFSKNGPMAVQPPAAPAAPQKTTQPRPHDHRETGRGY